MTATQPFESIDALTSVLKRDDPPPPPVLPGEVEFEWAMKSDGRAMVLARGDGMRSLYRGQNRRWQPCVATVWRDRQPTGDHKLNWILSRVRIAEFEALLKSHPAMELARANNIAVNYDSLAQHYGIPTFWLDVTSSIDIAAFFAVARFGADGSVTPCADGVGVIYRVHWRNFEEPLRYFASISHSPASRPGRQHGWSLGVNRETDFDSLPFVEAFEFCHSQEASERLIQHFSQRLFPPDSIVEVAQTLLKCKGVTMSGIKAALTRDGCPPAQTEQMSQVWGERLCNGIGLDVYLDEEFALTEEQSQAGERDASRARESFLSEIGVRFIRFPENVNSFRLQRSHFRKPRDCSSSSDE